MKIPSYRRNYDRERVSIEGVDFLHLRRLFAYLMPYKGWVVLSLVLLLAAKVIEVSVPVLIGDLTSAVLEPAEGFFGAEFPMMLLSWGCGLLLLLVIAYLLDVGNVLVKNWVGQRALFSLRSELYQVIQRMPTAFFDQQPVGRLMSRTIHDVEQINLLYSESIIPILGNILLLVGILLSILYVNWKVALITLTVFPPLYWLTQRFRKEQSRCFELLRAIVSALNGFIQEHLMGQSTVWVYGQRDKERQQFEAINEDHCTVHLDSIHHLGIYLAGIQFFHSVVLIAIFASIVAFAPPGTTFNAGEFFTFSLYALMVFRPIADLAERYNVLQSAVAAGGRVFDILDRPQEDLVAGLPLDNVQHIQFDDVWFAYQSDNWILKGTSFEVHQGESLAIVGVTGSGKSTIMNLLLRLYEIQKGSIRINGRDIREYSLESLRRQFSVVPQDPFLFTASLADNIALRNPAVTRQDVERAVAYIDLSSIVGKSPSGLDQLIAGSGSGLSCGERQLITLARAVAHNGSVYILDEATASIDTTSERAIQEGMSRILADKTAIVIAHRLSTVRHATRILVIHQGRVAESGSHEELLQHGGIYEKLYRLQFRSLDG